MELQVLNQVVPVIDFNKEELKIYLQSHLDKYSNLVVTSETEKDCKKVKAELGKLEKAIETFRKDMKKALSEPITNFEADCKELVALIQEVKTPIDVQLNEIEEQRKAEKEVLIREEIAKIIVEYELDEKHSAQIDIKATWLNKTTSMSKITTELKNLAETLKIAQMSVVRHKQIIETTCDMHNGRLKNKLDAIGWIELLASGEEIQLIVEKIHAEGKRRLAAEIEEEEKEAQDILNEPIPDPVVHEEPIKPIELCKEARGKLFKATLEINLCDNQEEAFNNVIAKCGVVHRKIDVFEGTVSQLNALKSIMDSTGIKYEKVVL